MMATMHELEAFCATCPPAQDVTRVLQQLGFRLTFQLGAITYPPSSDTPLLPAQFHYSDAHETEVIYLAGHDTDPDGRWLPPHASHWWLYPGANPAAAQRVVQVLATTWSFTWCSSSSDAELRQSA